MKEIFKYLLYTPIFLIGWTIHHVMLAVPFVVTLILVLIIFDPKIDGIEVTLLSIGSLLLSIPLYKFLEGTSLSRMVKSFEQGYLNLVDRIERL